MTSAGCWAAFWCLRGALLPEDQSVETWKMNYQGGMKTGCIYSHGLSLVTLTGRLPLRAMEKSLAVGFSA